MKPIPNRNNVEGSGIAAVGPVVVALSESSANVKGLNSVSENATEPGVRVLITQNHSIHYRLQQQLRQIES